MGNAKLWEPPMLLAWLHECATLLYQQYYHPDVTWRAQHHATVRAFRESWASAAAGFYRCNDVVQTYEDATAAAEFQPGRVELAEGLRLRMGTYSAMLRPPDRQLLGQFKPPSAWLSLDSSPVILFFQSLVPNSAIDRKGGAAVLHMIRVHCRFICNTHYDSRGFVRHSGFQSQAFSQRSTGMAARMLSIVPACSRIFC